MKTPKEQALHQQSHKTAQQKHTSTIITRNKAETNHEDTKGTSNTSRKHKNTKQTHETTISTINKAKP